MKLHIYSFINRLQKHVIRILNDILIDIILNKGNDTYTLGVQQWYNNKTYWGETQTPLLYIVSILIISH
jgi:hypothetical protein